MSHCCFGSTLPKGISQRASIRNVSINCLAHPERGNLAPRSSMSPAATITSHGMGMAQSWGSPTSVKGINTVGLAGHYCQRAWVEMLQAFKALADLFWRFWDPSCPSRHSYGFCSHGRSASICFSRSFGPHCNPCSRSKQAAKRCITMQPPVVEYVAFEGNRSLFLRRAHKATVARFCMFISRGLASPLNRVPK